MFFFQSSNRINIGTYEEMGKKEKENSFNPISQSGGNENRNQTKTHSLSLFGRLRRRTLLNFGGWARAFGFRRKPKGLYGEHTLDFRAYDFRCTYLKNGPTNTPQVL